MNIEPAPEAAAAVPEADGTDVALEMPPPLLCSSVSTRERVAAIERLVLRDTRFSHKRLRYPVRGSAGACAVEVAVMTRINRAVSLPTAGGPRRGEGEEEEDELRLLLETESIPQMLWPGAHPFAHWIAQRPALFARKRVLELGSGVGLAGFVASRFAAVTVLSDCSAVSLALCGLGASSLPPSGGEDNDNDTGGGSRCSRVLRAELPWGDTAAVQRLRQETLGGAPFDVVIGCDIFYFRSSLEAGLRTARVALTSGGECSSGGRFYCASFVRSERMDDDLVSVPPNCGFAVDDGMEDAAADSASPSPAPMPVGGAVRSADRQALEVEHLRVFTWRLS